MPNYAFVPVDDDRVYAFTFPWDLPPIWWDVPKPRPVTFESLWQSDVIHPTTPVLHVSGVGAGLYVGSGSSIYKLALDSGQVVSKWSDGIQGEVTALDCTNGVLCFCAGDYLHGLNLNTGTMWSHAVVGLTPPVPKPLPAPAASEGKIFSAVSGGLRAFNTDGTEAWLNPLLTPDPDRVVRIRAKEGRVYFTTRFNKMRVHTATGGYVPMGEPVGTDLHDFVVVGYAVYALAYKGDLDGQVPYVIEFAEGGQLWETPVGGPGVVLRGPAYANGKVIFAGSASGEEEFVYGLSTSSHEILKSTIPVASGGTASNPDGKNMSDPAAACGKVFVTSQDGYFYALSDSTLKLAWKAPIPSQLGWFPLSPRPTIVCDNYPTGPEIDPVIDLLALILPGSVYAKIKKYEPAPVQHLQAYLRAAMSRMTPEERWEAFMRSKAIGAKAKELEAVFGEQE